MKRLAQLGILTLQALIGSAACQWIPKEIGTGTLTLQPFDSWEYKPNQKHGTQSHTKHRHDIVSVPF
jgi:hypothetical protein